MPTVLLLDASLSMLRPVENGLSSNKNDNNRNKSNGNIEGPGFGEIESALNTTSSGIELMNLAKWGIDKLLNHFEQSYKLEQIAVLTFSSQCDLVVPFTRDIAEVRAKVCSILLLILSFHPKKYFGCLHLMDTFRMITLKFFRLH